jgi:hypothetical protein
VASSGKSGKKSVRSGKSGKSGKSMDMTHKGRSVDDKTRVLKRKHYASLMVQLLTAVQQGSQVCQTLKTNTKCN